MIVTAQLLKEKEEHLLVMMLAELNGDSDVMRKATFEIVVLRLGQTQEWLRGIMRGGR